MSRNPLILRHASREEWLADRARGIGASEVAAVVGISPWDTPFSLWLKKTGQVPPEPENQAMRMGHLLEPVIAQLWEEETGGRVVKASARDILYVDREKPWRRVTPDRLAKRDGAKRLLEFKSTSKDIDADDIPLHWICQCQYQMLVTGIHNDDLCWLTNGRYFGYAHIEYDTEFAEYLGEQVDMFWRENVIGGKEPVAIVASDISKPSTPDKTIEADSEAIEQISALRAVKSSLSELTDKEWQLTDNLKLYMGDAEALVRDGRVLATWKSSKRGRPFLLKKQ